MKQALAIAALLPALAFAQSPTAFEKLKKGAEPLGALGAFLTSYTGDCGTDAQGGSDCKKKAAEFRSGAIGKKYYMILGEESAGVIAMGPSSSDTEFILNVTPFFAANGSALTHGAPSRTDANGNPVMPFLRVKATAPEGMSIDMVGRLVSMRGLRVEVVFSPQGTWTLPKKGGEKTVGVKAKLSGMLITVGRTGQVLGEWVAK